MKSSEASGETGGRTHQDRRRAWGDYAILLSLMLLAVSSFVWREGGIFTALLPGQQAAPATEAEPYRTLKALFPDVYAQIVARPVDVRTEGGSRALAQWLEGRSASIAAAPDAEMLALAESYLHLLRGVRALDPVLCGQLVTGDAGAAASLDSPLPSIAEQLRRGHVAAQIRAAKAGSASTKPLALKLLRSDALALDRALGVAGHGRALLVVRHPDGVRLARVCDDGVALEQAILALPYAQAARIQRSVLGDVWRLPD